MTKNTDISVGDSLPEEMVQALRSGLSYPIADDLAAHHVAMVMTSVAPIPAPATPVSPGVLGRIKRRFVLASLFTGLTAKIIGAGVALATVTGGVTATGALPEDVEEPLAATFEVLTLGAFPDMGDNSDEDSEIVIEDQDESDLEDQDDLDYLDYEDDTDDLDENHDEEDDQDSEDDRDDLDDEDGDADSDSDNDDLDDDDDDDVDHDGDDDDDENDLDDLDEGDDDEDQKDDPGQ